MQRDELHRLILGPNQKLSEKRVTQGKAQPLTILPIEGEPKTYALHVKSAHREWVSILVTDAGGEICLQKERRCKVGYNIFRVDLSKFISGRYRIDLLSSDMIQTGTLSC